MRVMRGLRLIDADGQPLNEQLRQRRRSMLLDRLYATVRPDVVVLESFPFGRRAFRFELEPLIAAARAGTHRPPLLCSLRDIIVMRDDEQRRRDVVERVRRDFTAVLVHGDPTFIQLDASFPAASDIADRLMYTGYVAAGDAGEAVAEAEHTGDRADDLVLVSAGGGAAGKMLLTTALAARRAGCLAKLPWLLLTGTNLPEEDFRALSNAALPQVSVERFRHDLPGLLRRCRVSVSQAGYNTVLDILRAGARAVLVPYEAERETEQLARADRLRRARRGRIAARERVVAGPSGRGDHRRRFAASSQIARGYQRRRARGGVCRGVDRAGIACRCQSPSSMNRPPSDNKATSAGWSDLAAELDRWSAAGQVAEFWWRDDDAVAPSSQLDRLLRLADGVPLALAVIPALARPELARMLNGMQKVAVLQHGWQHANHAGSGKKERIPRGRSASVVAAEIGAGIARLRRACLGHW